MTPMLNIIAVRGPLSSLRGSTSDVPNCYMTLSGVSTHVRTCVTIRMLLLPERYHILFGYLTNLFFLLNHRLQINLRSKYA